LDLLKILLQTSLSDKEDTIKFWKSSASAALKFCSWLLCRHEIRGWWWWWWRY